MMQWVAAVNQRPSGYARDQERPSHVGEGCLVEAYESVQAYELVAHLQDSDRPSEGEFAPLHLTA